MPNEPVQLRAERSEASQLQRRVRRPREGELGVRREGPDLGSKFRKFQSFLESFGYAGAP